MLLALIANRRGPSYLEQLLPQLLAFARQSPAATQMVSPASPAVIAASPFPHVGPHGAWNLPIISSSQSSHGPQILGGHQTNLLFAQICQTLIHKCCITAAAGRLASPSTLLMP